MVCVFKDCKSRQRKTNYVGLSFFRFPRNRERCEIWRKNCNNESINALTCDELRNRFVCELHFNKEDLEHYELPSGIKRKLLKKTALPGDAKTATHCEERCSIKRKEVDDTDDISTPKAICRFIQKASGTLVGHLDSQQTVFKEHHDRNADHSYCRVMMELCSPNKACRHSLGCSVGDYPLMRPISPPPSDPDDSDYVGTIPVGVEPPTVTMATNELLGEYKPKVQMSSSHSFEELLGEYKPKVQMSSYHSSEEEAIGKGIVSAEDLPGEDKPKVQTSSPHSSEEEAIGKGVVSAEDLPGEDKPKVQTSSPHSCKGEAIGKGMVSVEDLPRDDKLEVQTSSPHSCKGKAIGRGVVSAKDLPHTPATTRVISATTTATLTTTTNSDWTRTSPSSHSKKEREMKKYKISLPKLDAKNGDLFLQDCINILGGNRDLEELVLNMSGQSIKKLEDATPEGAAFLTTTLVLDNNSLKVLPTIGFYERLTKVSLVHNKVDSLIWFRRLSSLKELDLSRNKLTDVDDLWKLRKLTRVNLSGNRIKVLKWRIGDSLPPLEFIDLSCNIISVIRDISVLTTLRELLLHQNQLKSLNNCKKFLPRSLTLLTLAKNKISNLCDVSELSLLCWLRDLSLGQNPCMNAVQFIDAKSRPVGVARPFDYRPFVLTYCPSLASLDNVRITDDERAEATWLLREGRIREKFAVTHTALITFLSEMCPLGTCEAAPDQRCQDQATTADVPFSACSSSNNKCMSAAPSYDNVRSESESESAAPSYDNVRSESESEKCAALPQGNKRPRSPENLPCEHFIQLIEEKAKNHRLMRVNERMEERLEQIALRIRALESRASSANVLPAAEFGLQLEIKEGDEE